MTTNRQPRRLRRQMGVGNGSSEAGAANLPISDRLRDAREARGVDLFRVERDTKIRIKYLAAMEQGEFSELPGAVYARGFLRNYATYLGLDPDEAEGEWRRGNVVPRVKTPPVQPPPAQQPAAQQPAANQPKVKSSKVKSPKVKSPAVDAPVLRVEGAAAPAFKLFGFALPAVKWSAGRPAGSVPAVSEPARAVPKPVPAGPKPPLADPTILESPPWKRRSFASGIPALLRRRDQNAPAEPVLGGPQPISMPGRSLVLQPIHIVLLLLAVVIVAVMLYFSNQATRVLQNPMLTVTAPTGALETVPIGASTYTLVGKATPKAEIYISWDTRDPDHTVADAAGNWSFVVTLHSGNNQFEIWSTDLATSHDSVHLTRIIDVPTPSASPVTSFLSVDSPTEGEGFANGSISVTGTTVAVTSVTVTASYMGLAPSSLPTPKPTKTPGPIPTPQATIMPPPTPTPLPAPTAKPKATPASSNNPAPVQVTPTIDGNFSAPLRLTSGRWKLTVVGTGSDGLSTVPVVRNVIVTAGSLVVVLQIRSGDTVIKIWQDGKIMGSYNNAVVRSGTNIKIVANQSVWFYATLEQHVLVTVNGVAFGHLTTGHGPGSWRITAFGAPTPSNDR